MSKIVGDIAIKVGADTTSLVTGMRGAEVSLAKFAKVGGAAAGAVAVAVIALTKASMDNIDVLAKQARSLGLSTQAFQKMAMVAGEAGVEAEQLSGMLGKMQKNISELGQGTSTQVEAFKRLGLSMSDLSGLSADEQFAKIAESLDAVRDPTEKTALAMEVFGKSGKAAINMLSGYSEAAANAAEFQNRFGIAVSQSASDGVERANDAVGRLSMVMEGLGNTLAGAVAPAVEATANGIIAFVGAVTGAKVTLEEFFGTLENAKETLGEDVFNKIVGRPELIVENAQLLQNLGDNARGLAADAGFATEEMSRFADQLDSLGQIGAAEVMRQYADELDRARQAFSDGTITGEEFRAKVKEIEDRASDLVTELANVDGISFGGVMAELANLATSLFNAKTQAVALANALPGGMSTGTPLSDQGIVPGTYGPPGSVSDLAPPSSPRPRQAPALLGEPDVTGGKKGGGGGAKDVYSQRVEALIENLKTETEIVAEWYAQSLDALNHATDAQLEALGGRYEAMQRLEQEHQEKMAGIRDTGNQDNIKDTLAGAEKLIGIVAGGNKRLMALQKTLAIANSWLAFTEVLKDPSFVGRPWARAIAAGQALASGLAAAKNIGSSGTGTGGAGSAATSAPSAPAQPNIANVTWIGEPTREGFGSLTEKLNAEFKQGYVLNLSFR